MPINLDGFKSIPIALLKFSDEIDRLKDLQKGNLFMNTLGFFKDLEEKENKKGIGDKDEGVCRLNVLNVQFFECDTNKLFCEMPASRTSIIQKEDLRKHVFCMSYLDYEDIKIIKSERDNFKATLNFSNEQKKEILESFGEYVMVISYIDFLNKLEKAFAENNIIWAMDKVKYDDFNANNMQRVSDYLNNKITKYFWKDIFFQKQKEIRLIVLNSDSGNPMKFYIGDLTPHSFITSVEDLFNDKYYLEVNLKPAKD